jgi:enamine deaminase RidA (YjgF/YER057c/UK114 family)
MTIERLNPPTLSTPAGYSQVVVASGTRLVFVAGQVSQDADGNLVAPGDVVGQATQAFANVGAALEAAGATIADVAKITWYVVGFDPARLPELAAARRETFGDHAPASTLIGVQSLAGPEYLVEAEAVAVIE